MTEEKTYLPAIGDYVMYRQNGIYRVEDIRTEKFHHTSPTLYLVLSCAQDAHTNVYVPADRAHVLSHLRPPLTREEINDAIDRSKDTAPEWISESRERSERYNAILHEGDCAKILSLHRILSQYREKLCLEKKKFYASDEKLLNEADRLITNEFSFALKIPPEEVFPFIRARLKQKEA